MGTVPISKRLVTINTISMIVMQAFNAVVVIWITQHLSNALSPQEYALLPLVAAIMVFTPIFSTMLTGGIARYAIEAYARGDERRVTQIISSVLPVLIPVAVVILAIGLIIAWNIGRILNIEPARLWEARLMLSIMMLVFAIQLPLAPFRSGPYIRQKIVLRNVIEMSAALFKFGLMFALIFGVSTRVLWVPVATGVASVLEIFVLVFVSLKLVPALRPKISEFRWPVFRELTNFGFWQLLGQVGMMIRRAADPIILNKMAGFGALENNVAVASYHIGSMPDRMIGPLLDEATWPMQPPLTAMHAAGDHERIGRVFLRIGRLTLWAVMLGLVPLVMYREEILRLFLPAKYSLYAAAATVLMLTLAAYVFIAPSKLLVQVTQATARNKLVMTIIFCGHLLHLALALYFVGTLKLAAVGAGLAAFLSEAIVQVFALWPAALFLLNLRFATFAAETLLPGLIPAAVGMAAAYGMGRAVAPDTWLEVGFCTAVTMAVYLAAVALCLKKADRADLASIIAILFKKRKADAAPDAQQKI